MAGETDLSRLLASMQPQLLSGTFVFCTLAQWQHQDIARLQAFASFVEQEGLSLILPKARAEQHQLPFDGEFSCISLKVHSSLHAVGLTAAISQRLAEAGISANVVAAFYHDHVFVPLERAQEALGLLSVSEINPTD